MQHYIQPFVLLMCIIGLGSAQHSTTELNNDPVELPKPGVCGTSQLTKRILGGEATAINEFPWMAMIEYTHPSGKYFLCSGALINENYILTASHCVLNKLLVDNNWNVTGVRLGEWNRTSDPDCQDGQCADPVQDIRVVEIIPHKDYIPDTKGRSQNDIALLRLERPITYTDWIKPICLPISSELLDINYDGDKLTVAGWGKTESGLKSNIKLKVNLNGVSHDRCKFVYGGFNVTLTNKQLCAGGEEGKDTCNGDGGGSLMTLHKTDAQHLHYYAVGIVSFGPVSCAGLSVYTRVDRYIDWIKANIKP